MNRRDFLKLAGLAALGLLSPQLGEERLDNKMQIGDLLAKMASGQRLQQVEINNLRLWGNQAETISNFVKGIQSPDGEILSTRVPFPFDPIYSVVLSENASEIKVNIPSKYNHLFFIGGGRTTYTSSSGELMIMQFNGDTGSNYKHTGEGVANASQTEYQNLNITGIIAGNWATATADAGTSGSFFCFIPHIRSPFWKSTLNLRGGYYTAAGGMVAMMDSGIWENTSPITSIRFFGESGTSSILAGSSISVYGLR